MNPDDQIFERFRMEGFENPHRFYSVGVSYWLNGKLEEEELASQVKAMADHGVGGFCSMGVPKLFRPMTIHSELDPDYLTPEYFSYIKVLLRECEKHQLDCWLYDEGGWPSGNAGGKLIQKRPDLVKQGLRAEFRVVSPGEILKIPQETIYALAGDERVYPGESICAEESPINVQIYRIEKAAITSGIVQPDLLNRETAEEFIAITHEQYRKTVGEYFGKCIKKVFCDEPTAGLGDDCLVWTSDFLEEFQQRKGYELTPFIPVLFYKKSNSFSGAFAELTSAQQQARIDYYDVWTQLFVERFFLPIEEWCKKNGLLFGMHLSGEHETLSAASMSYGHIMRIFRKIDIPGVDVIWRQLFPGKYNHFFPRFASSAAHQCGKRWAFSESFTIFGIGLTPAQRKWLTDYQVVRGINLFATASSYNNYSENAETREPFRCDNEPMIPYLGEYYRYTKRLCSSMALGDPMISVAVFYPLHDLWCLGETAERAKRSLETVCSMLDNRQYDFDLIDDDIFDDCKVKVANGCLHVGKMQYSYVILPLCRQIGHKMVKLLQQALEAGVTVIAMREAPCQLSDPKLQIVQNSTELYSLLPQRCRVVPALSGIRISSRKLKNGILCLITNEGLDLVSFSVEFPVEWGQYIYRLDCTHAKIDPITSQKVGEDTFSLDMHLCFAGSILLLLCDDPEIGTGELHSNVEFDFRTAQQVAVIPAENLEIRPLYRYYARPTFERYCKIACQEPARPVSLGLWDSVLGERFCGEAEYVWKVSLSKTEGTRQILSLGDVRNCCTVLVNDVEVEKLLWQPYEVDITPYVRDGMNEIAIRVSNTAAGCITDPDTAMLWDRKEGPGWVSPYRNISKDYEYEQVAGGLFGPVQIRILKM
jgi:hypothetical protein